MRPLFWEVFDEHLDEAEFLFRMWERGLNSAQFSLPALSQAFGHRWRAHVDALALGGTEAEEQRLVPALGGSDAKACVACLAWSTAHGPASLLALRDQTRRRGWWRAVALLDDPRADAWILDTIEREPLPDWLSIAASRGISRSLRFAKQVPDCEGALRLARRAQERRWPGLERALADPSRRLLALQTAAVLGRDVATELEAAARTETLAMASFALYAGDRALPWLASALNSELRRDALFALGFVGTKAAIELALPLLEQPRWAAMVADLVCNTIGLDLNDEYLVSFEREPDEALGPLVEDSDVIEDPGPEAELPRPDIEKFQRYWKRSAQKWASGRWLLGRPWGPAALQNALLNGLAWRRATWAWGLETLTQGQLAIDVDASESRQYMLLRNPK